jgi:hypothetical protein
VTEADPERPQGPTDPHGPGGIDAPPPPGGPQRTDQPQQPGPGEEEPRPDEDALQAENAGTSLDQPSDNSGGE